MLGLLLPSAASATFHLNKIREVYPGTTAGQRPDEHPTANFDHYDAAAYDLDLDATEQGQLQTILDHVRDNWQSLATVPRASTSSTG